MCLWLWPVNGFWGISEAMKEVEEKQIRSTLIESYRKLTGPALDALLCEKHKQETSFFHMTQFRDVEEIRRHWNWQLEIWEVNAECGGCLTYIHFLSNSSYWLKRPPAVQTELMEHFKVAWAATQYTDLGSVQGNIGRQRSARIGALCDIQLQGFLCWHSSALP